MSIWFCLHMAMADGRRGRELLPSLLQAQEEAGWALTAQASPAAGEAVSYFWDPVGVSTETLQKPPKLSRATPFPPTLCMRRVLPGWGEGATGALRVLPREQGDSVRRGRTPDCSEAAESLRLHMAQRGGATSAGAQA